MGQLVNIALIEAGHVLETRYKIKAFKLFGRYYTTNQRRKYRYEFDDTSWKQVNLTLFWRIKTVMSGKAHRLDATKPNGGARYNEIIIRGYVCGSN